MVFASSLPALFIGYIKSNFRANLVLESPGIPDSEQGFSVRIRTSDVHPWTMKESSVSFCPSPQEAEKIEAGLPSLESKYAFLIV
jgi:hypothetical protein